jgi:hypothetical protein
VSGLVFSCSVFRDEINLLASVAEPFLEPGAERVLRNLADQVDNIRGQGSDGVLSIEPTWPLLTRPCGGAYEHDGGGQYATLHAEITARWEVHPVGTRVKSSKDRRFEVAGKASTVAELFVTDPDAVERTKVASWRMEIGNYDSPGAFFHVQIPESRNRTVDGHLALWPSWLSVPRIAAGPFTPMLAVEFVLGELFQEGWRDHVGSVGGIVRQSDVDRWRNLQEQRLLAYLDWQRESLRVGALGTPLQTLKWAKPPPALLAGDQRDDRGRRRARR